MLWFNGNQSTFFQHLIGLISLVVCYINIYFYFVLYSGLALVFSIAACQVYIVDDGVYFIFSVTCLLLSQGLIMYKYRTVFLCYQQFRLVNTYISVLLILLYFCKLYGVGPLAFDQLNIFCLKLLFRPTLCLWSSVLCCFFKNHRILQAILSTVATCMA